MASMFKQTTVTSIVGVIKKAAMDYHLHK